MIAWKAARRWSRLPARRYKSPILSLAKSMALSPGTRLGPYSVIAKIGEGDMNEVYRAIRPTPFLAARGHAQC